MKVVAQIGVILSALATQGMPASSLSLTAPFTRLLSLSRGGSRQIKPVGDYVGVNDTAPYLVEEMVAAETPKPRLNPLSEISAGTTVALASIPSSIAFASIAGVDPLVGVWSSVILGGVSAVTGMRPGLVAGAAGVVAVPLAGVVKQGPELMAPTIFLAAIMELVFATLKGGRLIELVSDSVMSGFLNALGFLLLRSQLGVFTTDGLLLPSGKLAATVGIASLTSGLSAVLPKVLPGKGLPTAMFAIIASTLVAETFNLPVARLSVGGGQSSFASLLPSFTGLPKLAHWAPAMNIVAPAAFGIAIISILETLLAVKVVNEQSENKAPIGCEDRSVRSMAVGKVASSLFGGFGGCGLIPQTLLNLQSGGRGALSVFAYCGVMAASVLCLSPLINKVPLASLAGVMIMVALSTVQWRKTGKALSSGLAKPDLGFWSNARIDMTALLVTSCVCFQVDMGTGILVGVVLEKLQYAIRNRAVQAVETV